MGRTPAKSGIYYTFDSGMTWDQIDDSDTSFGGRLRLLHVNENNVMELYATDGNHRFLRSYNGGMNWDVIEKPTEARVTMVFQSPHNDKLLIINNPIRPFDRLFRSEDGEESWEWVSQGFPHSSHGVDIRVAFHPEDSSKAYATADPIIGQISFYRSTNAGRNWTRISYAPRWRIGFAKSTPDEGNEQWILLNYSGRLYHSYNDGITWGDYIDNISPYYIVTVAKTPWLL